MALFFLCEEIITCHDSSCFTRAYTVLESTKRNGKTAYVRTHRRRGSLLSFSSIHNGFGFKLFHCGTNIRPLAHHSKREVGIFIRIYLLWMWMQATSDGTTPSKFPIISSTRGEATRLGVNGCMIHMIRSDGFDQVDTT